jgi:hypothetical protein
VIPAVQSSPRPRTLTWWWAALAAAFLFRLLFGLSSDFFFEDQTQVFLLGLRYFATGAWPYFGADVVWTKSEIPGALQALLVGLPLKIAPVPEAPFVLLNLLSTAALAWFAWYLCQRFPRGPRWLVWGWLLTIPWTMQFSTTIINTSYILPASLVFFIGFFECMPAFRVGVLSRTAAHAMMGAALGWLAQIHMSWPLLVPFAAVAWLSDRSAGGRRLAAAAVAFAGGALVFGSLLVPTWWQYGLSAGHGGTLRNIHLHLVNPWIVVTTLARFLSFASLEVNRFIGTDGAKRLAFFERHLWLAPMGAIVWLVGSVQPLWLLVELFRRHDGSRAWREIRWLVAASVALVYASYFFVIEPPQAHAFYVLSPVAFVYALYCWSYVDSPRARRVAAALLVLNVLFHAGFAWAQAPEKSLYKNREPVAAAVRLREPEMFAHRRPFAIGAGPLSLQDPTRPYDPLQDIVVQEVAYRVGFRGSTDWTVTVRNANPRVAYRDLLYFTTYKDATGAVVEERHEVIKDIFEPGAVRSVELNDGFVTAPFATAAFRIGAAEALLPTAEAR